MNKKAKIKDLLDSVQEQWDVGKSVDDEEIKRQHPELMPELADGLRIAHGIHDVRLGKLPPESVEKVIDLDEEEFHEDLAYLREKLGDYEFLDRVHNGGQGFVYKARQKGTDRIVAIKMLLDGPLASEKQRQRFKREIELFSRLRHPNIVPFYECGTIRNRLYFTMQYVVGLPIDVYVHLHDLTVRQVVELFSKVCHAVSHAHSRGVIHRDLKPPNILVDDDEGEPHILDFGLARATNPTESGHITLTGQVLGTLPYKSPEEAVAIEDEGVDMRSDVYALGIVLFEVLTQEYPYDVNGRRDVVRNNILFQKPQSLRKTLADQGDEARLKPKDIDDDLEAIVRKALMKDVNARYQTADALTNDLDRYLAGEAVEAKRDNRSYVLRKALRQNRVPLTLLLMLCISMIVAMMFGVRSISDRKQTRRVAEVAYSNLQSVLTDVEESFRPLAGGTDAREMILDKIDHDLGIDTKQLIQYCFMSDKGVWTVKKRYSGDISCLRLN